MVVFLTLSKRLRPFGQGRKSNHLRELFAPQWSFFLPCPNASDRLDKGGKATISANFLRRNGGFSYLVQTPPTVWTREEKRPSPRTFCAAMVVFLTLSKRLRPFGQGRKSDHLRELFAP